MNRILLLAALASVFAAPVHAGTFAESPERVVKLDRSKLDDQAYVRALYAQIETAAGDVCQEQFGNTADSIFMTKKCKKISVNRALRDVGAPAMRDYAQVRRNGTVYLSQ